LVKSHPEKTKHCLNLP